MNDDKHAPSFILHSPLVPPGYKQTEVGVIPEDWEIHTIGDSMRLINGRAFKPEDWKEHGLPIIRIQNLNDSESAFNYWLGPVEDRHLIEAGDLLFAWSGTTGTSFGARVWGGPTSVLNQHIFKVIPDQKKLTPHYAFLVLRKVQEHIEKQAHGFKASFVHVKKSDLVGVQLPFPPTKAEQEAIAEALSDADTIIESLEQLIAKKRQIKQGAMQELLRPKNRWVEDEIRSTLTLIMDYRGRTPKKLGMEWGSGDIRALSAGNVKMGRIDLEAEAYFGSEQLHQKWMTQGETQKDDILVTTEAPLGNVALIPDNKKYILSQRVILLRVDPQKLDSHFLFHFLSSNQFQNLLKKDSSGSTATGIQRLKFEKITVFYPQLLAEQTAIAAILTDMDAEIAALEAKLAKACQLKQGMMQALLTGRIRLV